MALPEALRGSGWTAVAARRMFPLLVWCAQQGKKITYGQLDTELQRRGWGHHVNVVVYGHPAGAVGNACIEIEKEIGEKIPPLNALVVNAKSGIPGTGCDYYLATYLDKNRSRSLTDAQRKAMAEETMEEVWRFQKWDETLNRCGLKPIQGGIPSLHSNSPRKTPRKRGWSNEPESAEHQALKKWVAENPQVLGSKIPYRPGKTEWLFASADRVDVMFEHKDGCIAVEVKAANANNADLERGIYQCIKYQALLRAELKAEGKIPNGSSLLITEAQLSSGLQALADLLGVRVVVVPVKRHAAKRGKTSKRAAEAAL
ncbi:hypothetical protein [Nitrospirillum iridis]|uniref:Uncharacterized protein n=1 Tax=Nitrospirillum iridis TaxID=765888 RepID=A0A7X0AUS2_9PROT|nr:hypothetical protein [Nitrospirillum iridis]MBB6250460.1 hypothetical protein [Nitrospirillum iridis]